MRAIIVSALAVMLVAGPAVSATQYYVGQKAADKTCSVMTSKPDGKTTMMVGKSAYNSNADAAAAMKAATGCKK
jgi:hypothetical protein